MTEDDTFAGNLYELEKSLFRSDGKKTEEVEAVIGDEFVEFGSSGKIYNKKQTVEAIMQGPEGKIDIENFKAMQLSDDAALVTYTAVKFRVEEKTGKRSLRSSIWKLVKGKWQIVFHQGTLTE